jgi:hypothetical protein
VEQITAPKGQGEEKMATTMKEVVSVWENRHSLQLKKSTKNEDGVYEIRIISFLETCQAEADPHYETRRGKDFFSIGFHIQRPEWFEQGNGDRDKLWNFLDEETKNFKASKQIKEKSTEPTITKNYPIFFDIYFSIDETAEDICDYIEQFIVFTYKGIAKYIGKNINSIALDFGYRSTPL